MVRHLLVALALLSVAVVSGVHYDALYDEKWPYPTDEELSADYDEYVGEQVLLFGDVESNDRTADRATIEVDSDNGPFSVAVVGIDADVEPGGVVQVYGTVRPGHTIVASNIVVVDTSTTGVATANSRPPTPSPSRPPRSTTSATSSTPAILISRVSRKSRRSSSK